MRKTFGWVPAFMLAMTALGARGKEMAQIGALVLDAETRRPLAGVEMMGHFAFKKGWGEGADPNFVTVRTDADGRCTASARTNKGIAGWHVMSVPEGYYLPSHGGWFTFKEKGLLRNWQPDNLVSTVLVQRVRHPIPLVVKIFRTESVSLANARTGGRLAYDFICGDWLPPVGKGVTADVEFIRRPPRGTETDRRDVTMRFLGEGNGIVEMSSPSYSVPLIRTAPENGYGAELSFFAYYDEEGQQVRHEYDKRHFGFRIRTRRDAEGRLVGGFYGKINDGITFCVGSDPNGGTREELLTVPRIRYYLNPAPLDRNLEWDRKTILAWNPDGKRLEPKQERDLPLLYRGLIGTDP